MSDLSALPTTRDIAEIKENIQSAGFFSFLSSNKKNAKNKASEWITRIGPKDSDERIISALDALLDQILAFRISTLLIILILRSTKQKRKY